MILFTDYYDNMYDRVSENDSTMDRIKTAISPYYSSVRLGDALQENDQVTYLALHSNVLLTPDGEYNDLLLSIQTSPSLEKVVLNLGMGPVCGRFLPAIALNPNIHSIEVWDCFLTTKMLIQFFQCAKHVKYIKLGGCRLCVDSDEERTLLCSAMGECQSLQRLHFTESPRREEEDPLRCLKDGIAVLPALRELELTSEHNWDIPSEVGDIATRSATLQHLILSYGCIDNVFGPLQSSRSVSKITFRGCRSNAAAQFIRAIEKSPTISSLSFHCPNRIPGRNMEAYERLYADLMQQAPSIKEMEFTPIIGGAEFSYWHPLARAMEHTTNLESLCCDQLDTDSFVRLTKVLPKMKALKKLAVGISTAFCDEDRIKRTAFVEALDENKTVTEFRVVTVLTCNTLDAELPTLRRICRLNRLTQFMGENRENIPLSLRPAMYAQAIIRRPTRASAVYQDLFHIVGDLARGLGQSEEGAEGGKRSRTVLG